MPEISPQAPVPFGPYTLIRRIGAGGMGEVFLAREEASAPPRALVVKKVLPHLSENRAFVGRFLDESKVVVRLNHPNIARVYAMGEVEDEYFLAMEYVQGKTISRFTKRLRERKQRLPLGQVLLLGELICQGLAYAHEAKDESGDSLHLVHRDLSPANVCISYRGEVKIIDFGAAQSTLKEEQTAPRIVIGNLTYMAPEQAKKKGVDRRADIYSAGVVLWELFAWHVLPQKGDPVERWRRAANPSWEAPSKHFADLPAEIDEAVLKALSKDPKDRYADAAEFGAELSRLRRILAPDVTERDLGAELSAVFQREKAAEDALLEATLRGNPFTDETTDRRDAPAIVPPTALAFEHRMEQPAPKGPLEETTDPGLGGPQSAPTRPAGPPVPSGSTRVGFGVALPAEEPAVEVSLLQEIEGAAPGDEAGEGVDTSAYDTTGRTRFLYLAVTTYLASVGVGFAVVWAWLSLRG